MAQTYMAGAVPAKLVRVSNTTLYRLAADELGDAMHWTRIARLNGLSDPWIGPLTEILVPQSQPSKTQPTGIYEGGGRAAGPPLVATAFPDAFLDGNGLELVLDAGVLA